jgi:type IV pilus assembly protein PilE
MITVAIVAILTAIAYPAYRNYVIRGQVINATNGLTTMAANMERYFQDNRTYLAANTFTPPCATVTTYGSFQVSCPNALSNPPATFTGTTLSATSFQLEAIGVSNSSGNSTGFYYFIDQQGNQGTTVTSPAPSAWITSCTSTWETKAGQC